RRTIYLTAREAAEAAAYPDWVQTARIFNWQSVLAVPVLGEGQPLGVIASARGEVAAFDEGRGRLLEMRADQAAIAIANAKLFREVQARNQELSEALERETATSEVLRAIASSPTEAQPVLTSIAGSAARLCGAEECTLWRLAGSEMYTA